MTRPRRAYPSSMTAKVQPHEARRYMDLGALGVIPKPFDPLALARELKAFLGAAS